MNTLTQSELIEMYDDMLDECTGDINIGYIKLTASRVLSEVDPIAYNCGLSDYYDSITDEYFCEYME